MSATQSWGTPLIHNPYSILQASSFDEHRLVFGDAARRFLDTNPNVTDDMHAVITYEDPQFNVRYLGCFPTDEMALSVAKTHYGYNRSAILTTVAQLKRLSEPVRNFIPA